MGTGTWKNFPHSFPPTSAQSSENMEDFSAVTSLLFQSLVLVFVIPLNYMLSIHFLHEFFKINFKVNFHLIICSLPISI